MNRCYGLKILPKYFDLIDKGLKAWEIRKDQGFKVGDYLILLEWDQEYTGRDMKVRIIHIFDDFGLKKDYVIMSIRKCG